MTVHHLSVAIVEQHSQKSCICNWSIYITITWPLNGWTNDKSNDILLKFGWLQATRKKLVESWSNYLQLY